MKVLAYIMLILLTSCQASKINKTWVAEDVAPKKFKKVLVLGVLPDGDHELQVKIENHLADDLRAMGYLAIASNKVFPAGTFSRDDSARASAALYGNGFDGLMTVVLLDKKKQPYFVPGRVTDYTKFNELGGFTRYYNTVAEQIFAPGYYGEETKFLWENNFYDLDGHKMVYSARTTSFDITSRNTLAHQYGQLMVNNLVKKNILKKTEGE